MFVKWVKQTDSTSSFTGKWSTSTVTCCTKVKLENQEFSDYNGVYTMDTSSGEYKQEGGDVILFQAANKFGFSGWYVGPDKNQVGLINPVGV